MVERKFTECGRGKWEKGGYATARLSESDYESGEMTNRTSKIGKKHNVLLIFNGLPKYCSNFLQLYESLATLRCVRAVVILLDICGE